MAFGGEKFSWMCPRQNLGLSKEGLLRAQYIPEQPYYSPNLIHVLIWNSQQGFHHSDESIQEFSIMTHASVLMTKTHYREWVRIDKMFDQGVLFYRAIVRSPFEDLMPLNVHFNIIGMIEQS